MSFLNRNVILIRHAESLGNVSGNLWGIPSDHALGLTPTGLQQVETLVHKLTTYLLSTFHSSPPQDPSAPAPSEPVVHFVHSPLLRAQQTAMLTLDWLRHHEAKLSSGAMPSPPTYSKRLLFRPNFYPDNKLTEFYSWVNPRENLSWFSYEDFLLDHDYPANKFTSMNVRSWKEMVEQLHSTYRKSLITPMAPSSTFDAMLLFGHHYSVNAFLYWVLKDSQGLLRGALKGKRSPYLRFLKEWLDLTPSQLLTGCKFLKVAHAEPIHLSLNRADNLTSLPAFLENNREALHRARQPEAGSP
jgi:hypothetical protein